ncbi:hypothetical protein D7024_07565 [Desulfofundulus salinus]|uniref:Uncharacterized protein n=1 Tax=Desulfofundulus salinus TaxID=2419843 RepID=A0A494X0U9_9FIRM|nr:hypothetical protein D7024_07565 [Desulfofundulus salinum]
MKVRYNSHAAFAAPPVRSEASRGAVSAEHWSERGQRGTIAGSLNIYNPWVFLLFLARIKLSFIVDNSLSC